MDGTPSTDPSSFFVTVYVEAGYLEEVSQAFTRSTAGCATKFVDWSNDPLAFRYRLNSCNSVLLRIFCNNPATSCPLSYHADYAMENCTDVPVVAAPTNAATSSSSSTPPAGSNASTSTDMYTTPTSSDIAGLATSNISTNCSCPNCEGVNVLEGYNELHPIPPGTSKFSFTALSEDASVFRVKLVVLTSVTTPQWQYEEIYSTSNLTGCATEAVDWYLWFTAEHSSTPQLGQAEADAPPSFTDVDSLDAQLAYYFASIGKTGNFNITKQQCLAQPFISGNLTLSSDLPLKCEALRTCLSSYRVWMYRGAACNVALLYTTGGSGCSGGVGTVTWNTDGTWGAVGVFPNGTSGVTSFYATRKTANAMDVSVEVNGGPDAMPSTQPQLD
ncbi:hypothetical protein OEZ85_013151 [Tetradesmus obliquus]|uniref:Pherophorin domain-containing protein n=1 Tax=Tetradesmus obliquus TaxID=3088 RepID=A0ABY8U5C6_TETOB|nr:hypothetical protein OEZ85_013151 [Tetradesmus obliquus]